MQEKSTAGRTLTLSERIRGGIIGKAEIQYKLIKTLAFSPWIYTDIKPLLQCYIKCCQ